jgi:hypothetical protein
MLVFVSEGQIDRSSAVVLMSASAKGFVHRMMTSNSSCEGQGERRVFREICSTAAVRLCRLISDADAGDVSVPDVLPAVTELRDQLLKCHGGYAFDMFYPGTYPKFRSFVPSEGGNR